LVVRRERYTSAGQTCKGASYEGEIKGVVCKGARPREDTLEALYEARSYSNVHEKHAKLIVRGRKWVIGVEECPRTPYK
jgi:hypothetical protein